MRTSFRFIYHEEGWPNLTWDAAGLSSKVAQLRHHQGLLIGRMSALGFNLQAEANLLSMTEEIVKTSEIEGEFLDRAQVRSSLALRLGVDIGALTPADRNVEGIVEVMLDATLNHNAPLTKERLFDWHYTLFPGAGGKTSRIKVGQWRDDELGPMRVVSGPVGRERIHYEAPSAGVVDAEMDAFLTWFNAPSTIDPVVKAMVAHLWFVTIHPFDDGNGRLARTIADMALARADGTAGRFYSMSAQIRVERNDYYAALERTQRGGLDITSWLDWSIGCLDRAFAGAELTIETVLKKARFWDLHAGESFNDRQRKILNRLLDAFEGKLTSPKYASINKTSHDTATRDLNDLVRRGILELHSPGGRGASYSLVDIPATPALQSRPPAPSSDDDGEISMSPFG